MKLVKCDMNEVKGYYKKTRNQEILEEFVESGLECAKVEEWTNKTANSCANSINYSIKRFGYNNIKAFVRNGIVYLIKEQ